MELIDEHGNLFGVVNVIDALAVLMVLAVVVAGIAVVGVLGEEDPDDEPDLETRYATLDLGTQPLAVAEAVAVGDETGPDDGPHALAVTDVYAVPVSSDEAAVTVRAEVEGELTEDGDFRFGEEPFDTGQNATIDVDDADVVGTIVAVDDEGATLETRETRARFETTVEPATAAEIEPGDDSRIGEASVATIESVSVYPTADDAHRVRFGATLTTLERDDDLLYGTRTVAEESTIALATDEYDLEPTILELDATAEPGTPTTTTVEVDLEDLGEREAEQFAPGMTETAGGETWATIEAVDRRPASYVVQTDEGELIERKHPTKEDLTLTVELRTRETDRGLEFKGDPLRNGDPVYLDFEDVSIEERVWIVD